MTAGRAIGLMLGVAADGVLGTSGHGRPASTFSKASRALETRLNSDHPLAGVCQVGVLAGSAVLLGVVTERVGRRSPVAQAAGTAIATWAVLGAANLAAHGTAMARDLEDGKLPAARHTLANLDPRVPDELDTIALSRASVESLAENTADLVVAPLFWGALAGVPGLLGSRAVSLLRRQARGRSPRSRWFVARLDEAVHLVPTRVAALLTVTGAPVVGGSAAGAWKAWRRDTIAHPSPNAGRVEAAFAGALEIRVGGRTVYPHGIEELPVLGVGRNPDAGHVTRAVELSRVVGWLAAASSVVLSGLLGLRRRR